MNSANAAKPPVAVFDLDGTLADTAPDLIASLNAVLAAQGWNPLPLAKARDMIGAGGRVLIERGLESEGVEVTPARLETLYHAFLAHYEDHLVDESRLFPGVTEVLDALREAGFALAVCTNKIEAHSVQLLEALGIADRFAAICGRDSFLYYKPDPRHLTLTIERAGGDPARAVMVGDSRTDIVTAKAAGVPVIGVTFGYTDTPVRDLDPDRVVDDFADVTAVVQELLRVPA